MLTSRMPGAADLGAAAAELGRIAQVSVIPLAIPLAVPARFATREVGAREYVIVRIDTHDGLSGTGYTYVGANSAIATAGFMESALVPRIVGQLASPERLWDSLYRESLLLGRRGLALRAISAIDIAVWDALAKRANLPLYALLGGGADRVPAYASGGYYRPGDPLANIERELGRYVELGFTDCKIKVGGEVFGVDVDRVRVARETIGPSARLALDANNAWRTPRDALRFVRAVEQYDPWWIEEPLMPDDVDGHAEVARRSPVPIATGEIHATRWDFRDLIRARAADVLQPDAGVCGGITEWLRIAHAAATFDFPVAPHWHANLHVHLAASVSNCIAVEYFMLDEDIYNFERIVAEPLQVRDGYLDIPNRPGLGIVFDAAAIDTYRL